MDAIQQYGYPHTPEPPSTRGGSAASRPTQSALRRRQRLHEQAVMKQLNSLRLERKSRGENSRELARKAARRIAVDQLSNDWLKHDRATVEVRAYLVDKVMPTLILGVEKLLTEVQKRELADKMEVEPNFNPVNYLAQYLMRNNPKYSNFAEASPYVRGLRQVMEEIKHELYTVTDNKLAKIKSEARQKREVREQAEESRRVERERRRDTLMHHFSDWEGETEGRVEMSLVQNALRSFKEMSGSFPPELQKLAELAMDLGDTDESGKTLSLKEFSGFVNQFVQDMPPEVFDLFMDHMSKCAKDYRSSSDQEQRKVALTNLFMACDHSKVGLLDRHRILSLFENFYDSAIEHIRVSLRNPRRWPVVEVYEVPDGVESEDEDMLESNGQVTPEAQAFIVSFVDDIVAAAVNEVQVRTGSVQDTGQARDEEAEADGPEKQSAGQTEQEAEGDAEPGSEPKPEEAEEVEVEQAAEAEKTEDLAEEEKDKLESLTSKAAESSEQAAPSASGERPPKTQQSVKSAVSFAEGTIMFSRENTRDGLFSSQTRTQSQASAFDETTLNVSQFVQLVETFLGDMPLKEAFDLLVKYLKDGYVETDEEKMERLVKAQRVARSAKRKQALDSIFEKWDNDGSGYLDVDEVETVLLKYKDGQEAEAIARAKATLKEEENISDMRLSKREFRAFISFIADEIRVTDAIDYVIEYLQNCIERSYAERVRGEARKKWLQLIIGAAESSGARMEPVFKAVFSALYKDAETHGNQKKISANIAILENEGDDRQLEYVAATPEDAPFLIGKVLRRDMKGISNTVVDNGKPIHVPRVKNHGNIQFWNTERDPDEREGSFIVVPLKDHRKRVFGTLGIDTLNDPHAKTIFITHEIQYFQGVAKAFSIAYHHVDIRLKLMRIAESALSWIHRRSPKVKDIHFYMVEPTGKATSSDYVLRKMMHTDEKGTPTLIRMPPKMARKDNLFRDYLFKCADNSETVTADAYGERHLTFPLRDDTGMAVAIVDLSLGEVKTLPAHERKEVQKMLKLLQIAFIEITKEYRVGEVTTVLEAEKTADQDTRVDILFDRLMLEDLRENVAKLDARAYAELKSYKDPPQLVHNIIRAVLGVFHPARAMDGEFEDWNKCKPLINPELSRLISQFDPTDHDSGVVDIPIEAIGAPLQDVPQGEVAKHGSIPGLHLYNWVFVSLSMIEHAQKMADEKKGHHLRES